MVTVVYMWGSISYALKAPDIPPIKLKTWREPSWDHPKPGESEAENIICMCVAGIHVTRIPSSR